MRISIAQVEIVPGRPDLNIEKVREYVSKAKANHANMIVFPELMIPGYLISDIRHISKIINNFLQYVG